MNSQQTTPLREAAAAMVRAADYYPPEVLDEGGAWRLGGSAKRAWQIGMSQLREALDAEQKPA